MSLNKVILNGRIPNFDHSYGPEKDGKKAWYMGKVSVQKDIKPEGEKYYPSILVSVKAFGPKADFLEKQFPQGSGVIIVGHLDMDNDYTDKDGNEVKGGLVVIVDDIYFPDSPAKTGDAKATKAATKTETAAPAKKPSPFAKK